MSRVMSQLEELLRDDLAQLERLKKVKKGVEDELLAIAYATAERPGEQPPAGKLLPERLEEFLVESQVAMNEILLELGYMQDEEDRKLTELTARAARVRQLSSIAIIAGGGVGLVGGLLAVLLFTAGVVHRVQRSEVNARRLAEGLPLLPIPHGADEVGRLGVALEETRGLLAAREEALRRARDEAEQASQAKSIFLANVSHELRTPLNAIIGFTRLVVRRIGDEIPALQRDNLEKVLLSAEQLLGLINQLLDLSKIEAGKMEVFLESFALPQVIDEAVASVEPALHDGVRLVREVPTDLPALQSDREKLRQIILNLLSNAVKFTEKGRVTLSARAADGRLVLVVSDTGIGISPEALPHIFEEFRQADMSTTKRHGGTGLGLAIVKRFVTLLGGSIDVESRVGRGSAFTVTLPLRRAAVEGSTP